MEKREPSRTVGASFNWYSHWGETYGVSLKNRTDIWPRNPTAGHVTISVQFSSVAGHVRLFVTPWSAVQHASVSVTNSWSLLKLMSIELVMPSSHLILCRPFLLLPPIPPTIRVFSNESALYIRWSNYWRFSFIIILPMNIQGWFPLGWIRALGS